MSNKTRKFSDEFNSSLKKHFKLIDGELYKLRGKKWIKNDNGSLSSAGYKQAFFKGKYLLKHRLVFFLHKGYWPKYVDHIDREKLNNHPNNLKAVTARENSANRKNTAKSGYTGVYKNRGCDSFRAMYAYMNDGKRVQVCIGSFKTAKEAHEARVKVLKNL